MSSSTFTGPRVAQERQFLIKIPFAASVIDSEIPEGLSGSFGEDWVYSVVIDAAVAMTLWNIYPEEYLDSILEGMFEDIDRSELIFDEPEAYCHLCRATHVLIKHMSNYCFDIRKIAFDDGGFLHPDIHRITSRGAIEVALTESV